MVSMSGTPSAASLSNRANDFLYVDGMRLTGNRTQTQLNNVEEVQVLKGSEFAALRRVGRRPGRDDQYHSRKKPSALPANEIQYRAGRFGLQQKWGHRAPGASSDSDRLLYRVDGSFSLSPMAGGKNGANRFYHRARTDVAAHVPDEPDDDPDLHARPLHSGCRDSRRTAGESGVSIRPEVESARRLRILARLAE